MLTHQSTLLSKARKEAPSDAQAISHQLLTRAGYIDQLATGIFSLLPLGHRTNERLTAIVRQHMYALSAQEVTLPALQPTSLWQESNRLDHMDPPLFRTRDRHERELVLASTHEEVITDLARKNVESYKDLPLAAFQIQTKFRNEARATGGLLRVREFQMKDLYSFHRTTEELQTYYEAVKQAYFQIFQDCDLRVRAVEASSGSIGGSISHEFSIEAPTGEDQVAACADCEYAANSEVIGTATQCPQCGGTLRLKACIENGHIFQLGTLYSEKLQAFFIDQQGQRQPIVMGCYGIGIGRLMAAIAETHHDERGLVWPASVSPYDVHVVALQRTIHDEAPALARQLHESGCDVLYDDRDISAGQKFAESDLLGIALRVIISDKTVARQQIEVVNRHSGATSHMSLTEFLASWRSQAA